ncbi:MAG: hypothetical protein AVDCRST_MAG86-44 [uncultured Truepera sp.]|uniref:Major facilitator superfamily (MFS) profile domain-containing protein n=1 Tax=uncultured Truepera sp. TaxID=543023 RepID=A0A6J4UQM6_9DEIN|nr:MAG: hypothetical protein AVDCRST_MAG86-44 [uncultured Truepera sp.]
MAATLLSGYASRTLGRRGVLLGSALGLGSVSALGSAAGSFVLLTLLCFVMGAFAGVVAPTTQTLIAEAFGPERRGAAMALWGAGTNLGLLIGALATGLLPEAETWSISLDTKADHSDILWSFGGQTSPFSRTI